MAIKISFNEEEAIFIGLFFGFLIICFVFIFSYPSNSVIKFHTKNIMEEINNNDINKDNNNKIKSPPRIRKPNVKETSL